MRVAALARVTVVSVSCGEHHSCDQCRRKVLSGNAEISPAGAMRVVLDDQNKLPLELHRLLELLLCHPAI